MRRLVRSALVVFATLFIGLQPALSQEISRETTVLKATDLPGFDYAVVKNVDLDACQAACEDDALCRAFTFNQKAGWCFLKSGVGEQAAFKGAISGIVAQSPSAEELAAMREGELPFPASDLVQGARQLAADLPRSDAPPKDVPYHELIGSGDLALEQQNPLGAMVSYRQALAINPNDAGLWLKLAAAVQSRGDSEKLNGNGTYELAVTASYAAANAYLRAVGAAERAAALNALGQALALREMWRESIATYRASLELVDDAAVQARLDTAIAEHGFRITSHEVDAEAATPRICAVFSDTLPGGDTDISGYVSVEGAPNLAVETRDNQVCLEGVEHGRRYQIKLRAGLPSANGEELRKDVTLDAYVPDRSPFVGFANNAYVMPAGLGGGLPITSVNAETADVAIYRIGDRSIAAAVRNGVFRGVLDGYRAEDVANQYGEQIFEGKVDLGKAAANAMITTAIPVSEVLKDIAPGAYVVTAKVSGIEQDFWREMATQWFIVTDLGLTTVSGSDGVHAFVRSLDTAQPVANATVRLVAVNNEILGETRTDADGRALFAPGLARGIGGRAPQLLVAETGEGDYAFLDMSRPAFDLTDRGVEGRPSPGPLDAFLTTERGVYRPGETVFLTALLRDSHADATEGLALTMEVERPDGVIASKRLIEDQGAGGYYTEYDLVSEAMRGSWTVRLYADPKAAALTTTSFLVEDFEPERLAFEISAADASIVPDTVTEISVAAKYLYGATAPDLAVEADAVLRPTSSVSGFPGYVFGRVDDTLQTDRQPLGVVGVTDADGNVTAEVTVPSPQATTRPLEAQLILRLVDTNGRAIERSLTRPLLAAGDRIGLKPQFDEGAGLAEGSAAQFDVITVSPEGKTTAQQGLTWRLSRIEATYQWYRDGGAWKWEAITTTREVANGTLDTKSDGPVGVGAGVEWGRYLFEVDMGGDVPTSSSYEFYAGYYYPVAGSDTPDTLQVALDKESYRIGDTATLRLDPQFAGKALVMVIDDRVIDLKAVDVPAEGASIDLKVTADWGPGAYVTAVLYRPSDAAEKRMPSRALGLAFADVDPGDRQLKVSLDAPREALPREAFTTTVKLENATQGQDAYVVVAAVDLGILNLTNFKVPDPDGWYFGQRQLGMDIRDLYGSLIDPTQGMQGAIRSGGDGGGSRTGTPPPTSVLVALHSGIVKVGADGTATVTFEMPDFAGTVRLMAMAWTAKAVGHASADVILRDPVVVTMSPPRFLRLDDTSRLLVEINNVSGPAGTYRVSLDTGEGLATDAAETSVDLAAGARTALDLSLTGTAIGDQNLTLTVSGPDGTEYVKDLTLGVRATSAPRTSSTLIPLGPGEGVTLDGSYFADITPLTGTLTLAVGPIARLDVPRLLLSLDRYPYGCAEQVSSRALPLLYLNEVAERIGLGSDGELDQRVKDALANLLSKQSSSGGFGMWGPYSGSDLWLDAYVTDFLIRAKAEGYAVPEQAMEMALDNLSNQVSYASDFTKGGEDIAYALYDLARAGRAAIGDLRYYLEARLTAFGSPLAKAQLGAALALYGDRTRSAQAFAAAVADLGTIETRYRYRPDYGSQLRDTAGVLALAAEFKPAGIDLGALAGELGSLVDKARYTSTQEEAWTLLAAAALVREAGSGSVEVDGEALTGQVFLSYDQSRIEDAGVNITNMGNSATEAKVSVTGIPLTPPPASSKGFGISRAYYLPDGSEADLETVRQNDRFVVVLHITPDQLGSGQYIVADPLPAGFEIENPNLSSSAGVGDLTWLSVDGPIHTEARTDQYVAAFRYSSEVKTLTTAYVVRAVSPGTFAMPGATVEDMYRPELRANTEAGRIEIAAAGAPAAAPTEAQAPSAKAGAKAADKSGNR